MKDTIDSMSDEELFTQIAQDGMLVKRPLLIAEDFILIGFKKAEWEERF